jgi:hypothetical protein
MPLVEMVYVFVSQIGNDKFACRLSVEMLTMGVTDANY